MPPLDMRAPTPLYAQLAERFAAIIIGDQAKLAGRQLPPENDCVAHFKVSRPTIRQAMAQLIQQGLIERGRGRGTFVAFPTLAHDLGRTFESQFRPGNRRVRFRLIDREIVSPPARVRRALRLSAGQKVERIRRLRFLEGDMFGMEERYLPIAYGERITSKMLSGASGVSLIRQILAGEQARIAFTIRAVAADAEAAKLLGVRAGTPLLASEHTYVSARGAPVLHGTVLFRADRYEFSFQASVTPDR